MTTGRQIDSSSEFVILNLDDVIPPPNILRQNPDQAAFQELVESIHQNGQITPIVVRPLAHGKYELIAGLRRCMALDALGQKTVKAVIRTADDSEAEFIALVENLKRDDINPLDESTMFSRLIYQHGLSPEHIAHQIGKSISYVESRIAIGNWPEYLKSALLSKSLNLSQCTEIARGKDDKVQNQLYEWTIEMGANAKKISGWRKELERAVTEHVAAGGLRSNYIPPSEPIMPRFDCPACGNITTIDHQSILTICDDCYHALMTVIHQGYLRNQQQPRQPPQGGSSNAS